MKEIPKGTYKDKGCWHFVKRDGRRVAILCCPDCGANAHLSNHIIKENGVVEPSVVCNCGYHEFIKLKDFK